MPLTIDVSPGVKVIRYDVNQSNLYHCEVYLGIERYLVWLRPDKLSVMSLSLRQGGRAWRDALPQEESKIKPLLSKLSKLNFEWLLLQEAKTRLVTTN